MSTQKETNTSIKSKLFTSAAAFAVSFGVLAVSAPAAHAQSSQCVIDVDGDGKC